VAHHVVAMYNTLYEMVRNRATAQTTSGAPTGPDQADTFDARTFRRRVVSIAWLPGVAVVLTVAGRLGSVPVGIAGFVVLLAALWLYAERGDRIAARLRRRRG
jgi:hypothetical protein